MYVRTSTFGQEPANGASRSDKKRLSVSSWVSGLTERAAEESIQLKTKKVTKMRRNGRERPKKCRHVEEAVTFEDDTEKEEGEEDNKEEGDEDETGKEEEEEEETRKGRLDLTYEQLHMDARGQTAVWVASTVRLLYFPPWEAKRPHVSKGDRDWRPCAQSFSSERHARNVVVLSRGGGREMGMT
ncbi:unnamed protein product [Schistocephalus solidus]|uniref:Nucleolin-like n=1 Tax=Schistocephalus solidus TaxID=70667 RepID=A0A183SSH2_SCHSO|nr:unnamed protein product [Schistocephalus solidus]